MYTSLVRFVLSQKALKVIGARDTMFVRAMQMVALSHGRGICDEKPPVPTLITIDNSYVGFKCD